MSSLNNMLITAQSGVLTQQDRLATISHNIANVDTPGYHRQRAILQTAPPNVPNKYTTNRYVEGTGVRIANIVRVYNRMKETALLEQTSSYEEFETLANSLSDMEGLMNAGGNGALEGLLQDFGDAWADIVNDPDNLAERSVLLERATTLAGHLNQLSGRLTFYRAGIAAGGAGPDFSGLAPSTVEEVNDIATRLQDLNRRVRSCVGQDISANDLQDQRDTLLNELSQRIGFEFSPEDDVTIDGQLLVSGDGVTLNELSVTDADANPIEFSLDGAAVTIEGGSLAAWTTAASRVEDVLARLDTLAATLITEINALHITGYDLNGEIGLDFFTGTGAADIATAISDPRLVAAANTLHDAGPPVVPNVGDGANALEIVGLFTEDLAALGSQTFNAYHAQTMTDLGADLQTARGLADDGLAVVNMLKDTIQTESGVSLDEEMIAMVSAQRAYQAAARLVNVIDGMMDTVINTMKR